MIKLGLTLFSLILLGLSGLHFNSTQYIWAWRLSIVSTEYGHWLLLLCVLLWLMLAQSTGGVIFKCVLSGVLVTAAVIFALPSIELSKGLPNWSHDLDQAFGPVSVSGIQEPNFSRLWGSLTSTANPPLPPQALIFSKSDGLELSLDFYGAQHTSAAAPWVLVIHGGGWDSGERTQLSELNSRLSESGYAVAAVSYRLAPRWKWPSAKIDVLNAVAYLKAHAQSLGLDPSRWVVLGRSAGGQIAERVAYGEVDPTLKGCIAFYSPADLEFAYQFAQEDDVLRSPELLRNYLGGDPLHAKSAYEDASAIRFVGPHSPPTLLFHGPRDPLVWFRQSERLLNKLKENQVASLLVQIPWATHGFDFSLSGPGGQLSTYAIERFLGKVLAHP